MSVLLDTHAVLWFLVDSPQLSDTARTTVDQEIRAPRDAFPQSHSSKLFTWQSDSACRLLRCKGCGLL